MVSSHLSTFFVPIYATIMAQENEFPQLTRSATANSGISFTMERVATSASLHRGSATTGNQRIGQPTFIDDPGLKADLFRAIEGGLVTPLHLAVKGNHEEAVIWLLHFGAKPSARTRSGMTPMDLAVSQSRIYFILKEFVEDGFFPVIPEK